MSNKMNRVMSSANFQERYLQFVSPVLSPKTGWMKSCPDMSLDDPRLYSPLLRQITDLEVIVAEQKVNNIELQRTNEFLVQQLTQQAEAVRKMMAMNNSGPSSNQEEGKSKRKIFSRLRKIFRKQQKHGQREAIRVYDAE